MVGKEDFGKEAREAITSLRKSVTKMKTEGRKIGTELDNKQLRDTMYRGPRWVDSN